VVNVATAWVVAGAEVDDEAGYVFTAAGQERPNMERSSSFSDGDSWVVVSWMVLGGADVASTRSLLGPELGPLPGPLFKISLLGLQARRNESSLLVLHL
jgi:hypothetical protein